MGQELESVAAKMHETADDMGNGAERAKTLETVVRLRQDKIERMYEDIESIREDVKAIKKHLGCTKA
jgi:methyl-accepting chemotaxis protein